MIRYKKLNFWDIENQNNERDNNFGNFWMRNNCPQNSV